MKNPNNNKPTKPVISVNVYKYNKDGKPEIFDMSVSDDESHIANAPLPPEVARDLARPKPKYGIPPKKKQK
jgi:hypothetical protein